MKKVFKYLFRTAIVLFILLNIMAAFHAYKFTHFYDYGTVRPKNPQDWNSWDKLKVVLFGSDYAKSINQSSPDSAYKTLFLMTADSMRLEAWEMTHPASKSKGTVILFHGHGSSKSGILSEAYSFFNFGYNILMVDFRAHGGSEGHTCTIGMSESKDVKAAYDLIVGRGEKNIILWGVSMGAATIIHTIAEFDIKPAKIILESPFATLMDAVKGRMRMMNLPSQPLSGLLTFWGGVEQGFWAFDFKPSEYAKKINCPVLLQWGKDDPRVMKEETDAIYNNITAPKRLVIYEKSGHQSFCKNEYEKWQNEVKNFLLQ